MPANQIRSMFRDLDAMVNPRAFRCFCRPRREYHVGREREDTIRRPFDLASDRVQLLLVGEFIHSNSGKGSLYGFTPQRARRYLPDLDVKNPLKVGWPFLLDPEDPPESRNSPTRRE